MTSACWVTNKDFDCAQVHFGYGSRHDTRSYKLSLTGLLIIAKYDYEYLPHWPHLSSDSFDDRIIAEKMGLDFKDNFIEVPYHLIHLLPLKRQMQSSPITIEHPDGIEKSLEWYGKARMYSGFYPRNNYSETVRYLSYNGYSEYLTNIPSMVQIKKLNPEEHEMLTYLDHRYDAAYGNRSIFDPNVERVSLEDFEKFVEELDEEIKSDEEKKFDIAKNCYRWL